MIESRRSTDYLLEMNKTNHLFITAPKKRERGAVSKEGNETE